MEKQKMRIVMITGTYSPSVNGVAVSVSELKKSLEERGHEVFLFAPDNKFKPKIKEKNVFRYPSVENPIHKDYPIPLVPINSFLIKTLPKKKPDIVHVHHAYQLGYFAKLMADFYKIPLVFTYHTNHDLYSKKYASFLTKSLRDVLLNNSVYDFCRLTDLVISPAEHTTRKLLKKVRGINVVTIPSGVSLIVPKVKKGKLKKEYGYSGKRILLTVGRLSTEKNTDFLIKVMQRLPDRYLLLIVGDGPDKRKLKELVLRLGLQKKVKFLGKVEHKLMPNLYGLADVFVFASKTETQGLVFLEAMKFGIPIVAAKSAAAGEWLVGAAGLVSKKNPEAFAQEILKVEKTNSKKNSEIAKKIARRYSPFATMIKVENAYRSVIKLKK